MTANEWAIEYAERLTTRGSTYVPEDIANLLRLQVVKLEALRDAANLALAALKNTRGMHYSVVIPNEKAIAALQKELGHG